MRKIPLSLLFFFTFTLAFSQTKDILTIPSEIEKKEIIKTLNAYKDFVNKSIQANNEEVGKQLSVNFLKDHLSSANAFIFDDLDNSEQQNNYTNLFKYLSKGTELYQKNWSITLDIPQAKYEKIIYDKVRKYYVAEVKTKKTIFWKEIVSIKDTIKIPSPDSLTLGSDSIVTRVDTLSKKKEIRLSLYIKFDKENNISKNFRLLAVSKEGTEAQLDPLPALVTWWIALDPVWRDIFRKRLKLEEYPREYDIDKLTFIADLDCSKSAITDISPLAKFQDLRILNLSSTNIQELTPLSGQKYLKELDISNTQVKSLKGIENLVRLEKLNCSKSKLESIKEVANLSNLIYFNCAENDIDDISAVKNLVLLEELDFSLNIKITNISAVSELTNLTKLFMKKINIGTLDPLRKLEKLVYLDCFNSNITTLEPIRNLPKIYSLNIDHNKITTLDPIKNYKFLAYLSMASASITDLSELKNFPYMRELDISNTQVESLGPVHKFEYIKVLKCYYTKIDKNEVARFKKNHPDCQITYYY